MLQLNTVHQADCIEAMNSMEEGSVDLAFADPPFNIGYKYDIYDDRKDSQTYLDWSREWVSSIHRVLNPQGAFWLSIGDEYAAELKVLCQDIGFHCRSWVVWYYTFGVNCKKKFSRSHAHIFHFVKDANNYLFNGTDIAVPSARQLVYADARAAKGGRLPDDTWILRPQDLTQGFNPDEDTWYFPRVAGTFKEREGFHGCQMPEQLLGRIVRVSSNPGDLVLDPFSGSATTLTVAKKLGRKFIGFDISEDYITRGLSRLAACEVGDRLEGSPEPTVSAPATPTTVKTKKARSYVVKPHTAGTLTLKFDATEIESLPPAVETVVPEIEPQVDVAELERVAYDAFLQTSDGYTVDRVIADPELDGRFLAECAKANLDVAPRLFNQTLFNLRRAGRFQALPTRAITEYAWDKTDQYSFGSEIAWRQISDQFGTDIDQVFCDPELAAQFDQIAAKFAPGFSPIEYRWAALKFLKLRSTAVDRSSRLSTITLPGRISCVDRKRWSKLDGEPGLYVVYDADNAPLYAGESLNLGRRLSRQFASKKPVAGSVERGADLSVSIVPYSSIPNVELCEGNALRTWLSAYQLQLVRRESPRLNYLSDADSPDHD